MLAIIPARGGSKGLPGKNIKMLCGKPLIVYTIEEAIKSKEISRVIVSTDCPEIADISKQAGAEVPFLRPTHLASDTALAIDTYIYTCDKLKSEFGNSINEFTVLQPTSPLRDHHAIDEAIELFYQNKADSVISVVEADHPVQWYKRIDAAGVLREYLQDTSSLNNRQALAKAYLPNGAIFIFKYDLLHDKRQYYSEKTYPYIMTRESSIDIDNIFDFQLAEYLMLKGQSKV
jgi:CMP-N,N'-diacetyllegionaminic acid synthase